MNKFTAGLLAGGIVGSMGLSYLMSDKKVRNRMMRESRKLMKKSRNIMDNMSDMF